MYYKIFFVIYGILILITILFYTKNKEKIKTQTISSYKRFNSKKVVPKEKQKFYQLFCYYFYFIFVYIILLIISPIYFIYILLNLNVMLFVPRDVIYYYFNPSFNLINYFSIMLLLIPIILIIDLIANRGFMLKIDDTRYKLSVRREGKYVNIMGCLLVLLIGLPLLVLSFNTYRYCTEEKIVIKTAFNIHEKVYGYDDVDYVEKHIYKGEDSYDYIFYFKDGNKKIIADEIEIEKIIANKNLKLIKTY